MSVIRVDNFGPSAGGTTYSARGIAKAWVNFNGTGTVAVRDSENVSSLTDQGVGNYDVNFNSAMANANWSLAGATAPVTNDWFDFYMDGPLNTSAKARLNCTKPGYASFDAGYMHTVFHGDLA